MGPSGGVEDMNQIYDHDLYKNSPANPTTKFYVRLPHVRSCLCWLRMSIRLATIACSYKWTQLLKPLRPLVDSLRFV